MVYSTYNQTQKYPHIRDMYTSTKEHFHDSPKALEPHKRSTSGMLFPGSYATQRLDTKRPNAQASDFSLGGTQAGTSRGATKTTRQEFTWSGRLPPSYEGNGTFRLANGLTYTTKPLKMVPYSMLTFKSEYGDKFCKKPTTTGYGYGYGRDGYSTLRSSRGW